MCANAQWDNPLNFFLEKLSFVNSEVLDDNYDYVVQTDEEHGILCRRCGHEIANAQSLHRRVPSTLSLKQRNDTIMGIPGVLIQLFENPAGEKFEVIVAEKADVYHSGNGYAEFTWFPGYTWSAALCPICGVHLGWFFESQHKHSCSGQSQSQSSSRSGDDFKCEKQSKNEDTFVGLILDNILSADFAKTLTMVPKPKASRSY